MLIVFMSAYFFFFRSFISLMLKNNSNQRPNFFFIKLFRVGGMHFSFFNLQVGEPKIFYLQKPVKLFFLSGTRSLPVYCCKIYITYFIFY